MRERQPSAISEWRTCMSTVRTDRYSSVAISRFVRPSATRRMTWSCRGVRPAAARRSRPLPSSASRRSAGRLERPGAEPAGLQARLAEPFAGLLVAARRPRGRGGAHEQLRAVVRQLDLAVQVDRPLEVLDRGRRVALLRASSPSARASIASASRVAALARRWRASARTTRAGPPPAAARRTGRAAQASAFRL